MSLLKKLAGETAVYGLSSIVGRLLNYLLVPLYTTVLAVEEYGVSTEFYAYASLIAILFSYGMETAFFRYYQKYEEKEKIFSTATISLLISSVVGVLLLFLLIKPLSSFTRNEGRETLFYLLGGILAADAISALPFAWLRQHGQAKKFAFLRLLNIGTNIGLNLFFYALCPYMIKNGYGFFSKIYHPEQGIMYMFIANLVSSIVVFPFFIKEFSLLRFGFDKKLWKEMFFYAFPLIFMGLAGMINETFDRILLKKLIPDLHTAEQQIGIYGANYKLSILITLFIQAFRFAAEPFFFSRLKDKNASKTYAVVMNYFVIVCCTIFLVVLFYLDIFKHFLRNKTYWEGLSIVPILLLANIFLGVYYNLSIWYKLSNKTKIGAAVAILGAIITLILNYILIPIMGYHGAAWTTLICYFSMCAVSYFLGQKYYPVEYDLKKFGLYIVGALAFYACSDMIADALKERFWTKILINTLLLFAYLGIVFVFEKRNFKTLNDESAL
jgi:O-antigen/teichoic acid export membrane protein